jgi:uncharacterized membrane protein YedE/YeeE/rhodanese-related sulfurtransferase
MMAPLAKTGVLSASANLYMAVAIGFLLGFTLQRVGFTRATKIGRMFYLRDTDVPVAMFAAVATATLGLSGMALLGVIDTSRFYFLPTYLTPMAVGGLIFGAGVVIGGYCPGTSAAALVAGKIDALVYMVGLFAGTLLFGDLFPVWGEFYRSDYRGVFRLDELFGVSLGVAVLGVTVLCVAGIYAVRRLQARLWGEKTLSAMSSLERKPAAALALIVAVVVAFFPTQSFFAVEQTAGAMGGWDRWLPNPKQQVYLGPLETGRLVYDYADRITPLDLRDAERFAQGHLPGALNVTIDQVYAMRLRPGTVALLYGGDPQQTRKALKALWQERGVRAYAARSDYAELERLYLDPLSPSTLASLSDAEQVELRRYREFIQRGQAGLTGGRAPQQPAEPGPRTREQT